MRIRLMKLFFRASSVIAPPSGGSPSAITVGGTELVVNGSVVTIG